MGLKDGDKTTRQLKLYDVSIGILPVDAKTEPAHVFLNLK